MTSGSTSPTTETKKSHRSPAYPFISLPKAIELARTFWVAESHNQARVAIAAKHLGFSVKSGPGAQTIAAMTQFGLFESSGNNDARTVKLTPLAKQILSSND